MRRFIQVMNNSRHPVGTWRSLEEAGDLIQ